MNALDAIYDLIGAQAGITALTSTRIYREVLPSSFNPATNSLHISQATGVSEGIIERCNYIIRAFGAVPADAYAIYMAVKAAFTDSDGNGKCNLQESGGPKFLYVSVAGQAEAIRDPDKQWDYVQFALHADIINV